MRDRAQLEMTVGQFHDAQRASRQRLLVQLANDIDRARERGDDWIVRLDKRRKGEHDHGLKRADGTRACCPVHGCEIIGVLG